MLLFVAAAEDKQYVTAYSPKSSVSRLKTSVLFGQ
jgi:hypothetical protein